MRESEIEPPENRFPSSSSSFSQKISEVSKTSESVEKGDTTLSFFETCQHVIMALGHSVATFLNALVFITPLVQIYLNYKELQIANNLEDAISSPLRTIARSAIIFHTLSFITGSVLTGLFIYYLAIPPSLSIALQTLATVSLGLSGLFIINAACTAAFAYTRMYYISKRIEEISHSMNINEHAAKSIAYQELLDRHIILHNSKKDLIDKILQATTDGAQQLYDDLKQELEQKDTEITAQKIILDHAQSEYNTSQEQHIKNVTTIQELEKQFSSNRLMARYMSFMVILGVAALLLSNPIGLSVVGAIGIAASVVYVGIKIRQILHDRNENKIKKIDDTIKKITIGQSDNYTKILEKQLEESMENNKKSIESLPPPPPLPINNVNDNDNDDMDEIPRLVLEENDPSKE